MLRVATFNVNGIRACARRGFGDWLTRRDCDVVGLQEVRCPADLVPEAIWDGYQVSYHCGDLPGRNGVAVLSREPPVAVRHGFGSREFDREGRYLEVDLELGDGRPSLTVASVYLPKGGVPYEEATMGKYQRKMRFLASFGRYLTKARRVALRSGREFLVMGDFNIAHTELDLKNWRANRNSEGFLPQERAWVSSQLTPRTLVDVVRRLHPGQPGPFAWWSWRGQSFAADIGWRIDYQWATPRLAAAAVAGTTDRDESYEARMSDHAPVVVDYAV